jgi:uncharacterized protein YecT (DUF1311 family)
MIRVLVLALLLAAPTAQAQGRPSISEQVDRCRDQSNPGLLECAAVALDREDRRLNRVYQATLARLRPPQRDRLRAEQRQWIRDRDDECRPDEDGGRQAGVVATICVAEMTRDRADQLERMARPSRPR